VDPALVLYYFKSKSDLFRVAVRPLQDAMHELADRIRESEPESLGVLVAQWFVDLWEDSPSAEPLQALLRSACDQDGIPVTVAGITDDVVLSLAEASAGGAGSLGISLLKAHLIGLATARYVFRTEPLASADRAELTGLVAPVLQGYLGGRSYRP
jgi:AcrR family transcriptional regulator